MSREIDERVVQMRFESGQFNRNIQTSIHNLDELKKGLDFKSATKGFKDLDQAARNTDISALGKAVDSVKVKFSMLDIMALNVMNRISNAAINTGKQLIKSLTIDQITPGWTKYEQKTSAVQTIMAATAKQFSNTAEQMEVVNTQLDKLNWFTDETSYNFVDMVGNIGKFTSNNIGLEDSVTAMQGIAAWAAKSGANTNEASRAMYNLSQAMATGALKLQDWMSIENANMATAEFKETALQAAVELGTLKKTGEDTFTTLDGKMTISAKTFQGFRDSLQKGWLSKDVLSKTLNRYGAATNKLHEIYERLDGEFTTSSIVRYVDSYISAVNKARSESEQLGLSAEQTAAKVDEAGKGTAEKAAEAWNIPIEEATELLKTFDDEVMQFGLKAFKTAQEAKTFTEAIDATKDAISTGWMKTYELIFGDYLQAKEFWTNIANTLYDLFAAGGDARNEMLADWKAEEGQTYFVDSIYATLGLIINALTIIKTAWRNVFGTVSGKMLADLTKRLNKFLVSLMNNEKFMSNMIRVFQGLFGAVDILKTTIQRLVSGALDVLGRILAELNLNIGGVAASAGDAIFIFSRWYKQSNFIQIAFQKIGDAAVFIIRKIKELISSIENFGPIRTVLDKLSEAFGRDFGLIDGAIAAVGGAIGFLWNKLQSFKFPTSFAEAKQIFIDFATSVHDSLESMGFDFSKIEEIFNRIRDAAMTAFGATTGAVSGASAAVKQFTEFVKNLDIDWAGVLLAGYGVTALAILWKFTDALKGFAGALKNVTGVGASAKGAMDSIKDYFKALKKNVETDNLLKTAIAITLLTGSLAAFSRLDWQAVGKGAVMIIAVSAAVVGLSFGLSKMSGDNGWAKGLSGTILALAAGIALLTLALNKIPLDDSLTQRVVAVGVIMTALAGVSVLISKFSGEVQASAASMVGIALAVMLIINSMKSIGREDIGSIYAATPVIAAIMVALGACARLMNMAKEVSTMERGSNGGYKKTTVKNSSGIGRMIAMIAGIQLLILSLKGLAKEDPAVIGKGIMMMIPIMALLALFFKATSKAGKEAAGAGKMILYISAALLLLKPAITGLLSLSNNELTRAGIIIAALSTFVFIPLIKASKNAGQYAGKAGILILAISGAMMVLQLVIKTLGKLDFKTALKGTASLSAVILSFAVVVKSMQKQVDQATNLQDVDVWKKLTVVIGIIGGILVALSILNPTGALQAGVGLAAVFASLGVFLKMGNQMELPDSKKMMKLAGIVAIIGGIIGIMGAITDWQGALAVAGGMSMILLTLASMTQILKNSATGPAFEKKVQAMLPLIKTLGAVMSALSIIVGVASYFGADMKQVLYVTTGMSELIISLGVMAQLMKKMELPSEKKLEAMSKLMNNLAISVGIITGLIGIIVASASVNDMDFSQLLIFTTGISELIIAFGAAMKLMSGAEIDDKGLTKNMAVMTGFAGAIGIILAAIMGTINSVGGDISGIIALAASVGLVITALGKAAEGLANFGGEDIDIKGLIAQAVALGGLIAAISAALGYFSKMTDPVSVLPLAVGVSAVLLAAAKAAQIVANIPPMTLGSAIKSAGLMAIVIGAVGLVMFGLGTLAKIPFVTELVRGGVELLGLIGEGIGRFVGGLVGGLIGGAMSGIISVLPSICENISQSAENLVPFFNSLKNIPGGILGYLGTLVAMIAIVTAATFVSGLTQLPVIGWIMKQGSEALKEHFTAFGEALKAFSDSIEGIDADKVLKAAQAVSLLGNMEMGLNSLQNIFGSIFGNDDLESFGNRLEALGEALSRFADSTANIDASTVEGAAAAAQIMANLENNLPKHGGVVQDWLGDADLATFGANLRQFGFDLLTFANVTHSITKDSVEGAANAGKILAELEKELQPTGGVIQDWFFGNKDFASFGQRISSFGLALVGFSNTVSGELNLLAFSTASACAGVLVDLEKTLDTTGGVGAFWSGDSSLDRFGSNIKSFGACLVAFSNQLKQVDMGRLVGAVTYIERLVGLQDLDAATNIILVETKAIINNIHDTIANNKDTYVKDGESIVMYIAQGIQQGTGAYGYIAKGAANKIANEFVMAFCAALGIHSPSLVMKEQGYWIVEGVADGIDANDSAEEAAKKKADNIVKAFDSAISKLTSADEVSNLEFELWQRTEGQGASDVEIAQKQMDLELQQLATLAKTVSARKQALNTIAATVGEDSEEYQEAYKSYLNAQITMLDKQSELDAQMGQNGIGASSAQDKMIAFADYMRSNTLAYEMLGKSQEELENAAYKAVYGLDEEAVARKRNYESLMQEYSESFAMLGKTREELDAFAKEKSGWEGIAENAAQTMSTTAQVIADNIDYYQVNIEETVATATAEAIKNATKKGGGSGSADGAAAAGGESLGDTIAQALGETIEEKAALAGEEGMGIASDIMSNPDGQLIQTLKDMAATWGITLTDESIEKILEAYPSVSDAIADLFNLDENGNLKILQYAGGAAATYGNALIGELNSPELVAKVKTSGKNLIQGYEQGVKEGIKKSATISNLTGAVNSYIKTIQQTQDSHSPSKVTEGLGQDFVEGYDLGIEESTPAVADTSAELANTATSTLSENAGEKQGKDIGMSFSKALIDGMMSQNKELRAAALSMANQMTSGAGGGGQAWLKDGFERTNYDAIYSFMGKATSKDADKAINSIGYMVSQAKKNIVDGYATIGGKKIDLTVYSDKSAVDKALTDAAAKAYSNSQKIGNNIAKGVTSGMNSMANGVKSAVTNLVNNVKSTAQKSLGIHSPSKFMEWIGNNVAIGFGNGMLDKVAYVNDAADSMTNSMIDSMDYAKSAIQSIIDSDDDFSPVITPVVDLDELQRGGAEVNRLFGGKHGITVDSARIQAGQISATKAALGELQNGSKEQAPTQNYTFTQNNYSPKALSRSEIYRQTNNQFSRLKEATRV